MTRFSMILLCAVALCAGSVQAVVIDHGSVDLLPDIPQGVMDAVGEQSWLFTHASVGSNMVSGMASLHSSAPARYQLARTGVGYNSSLMRAYNAPATAADGMIYDCSRGNPGWANKYTIFQNSVNLAGWNAPAVDVVMDKLCYIDQNANVSTYLSMMTTLEAAHPDTVFVYTTIPLMVSSSSNTLRNQYNIAVRAHCQGADRVLYDIADIEAHDASGVEYTFLSGSTVYQQMYGGWSYDGGHLNTAGQVQVAKGWYATAALIATMANRDILPADGNLDGRVDIEDFVILKNNFGQHVPEYMLGDYNGNGYVNINDFILLKNTFGDTAVPEPGTLALLAAGAAVLRRRRRRR